MAKRSTAGLIKYVKFLVDAGAMREPRWLSALEKVPPPLDPQPGRRPPTILFPEDELVRQYYRRHPEARLEPLDLGSFEPPAARRFAARQMELMGQGLSSRVARELVEGEFVAAAAAEGPSTSGTVIEVVQSEEESHLKAALSTYTERHGHRPLTRLKDTLGPRARGNNSPPRPLPQQGGGQAPTPSQMRSSSTGGSSAA